MKITHHYSLYELSLSHEPGIDFDEVHRHHVRSRGQLERLLDDRFLALYIVPTTNAAVLATVGNFFAVPAIPIIRGS